jgi:hypothetical protein
MGDGGRGKREEVKGKREKGKGKREKGKGEDYTLKSFFPAHS